MWYRDGEVVYKDDDIVTYMYIVLSGYCNVYKKVRMLDHTFKVEDKRDNEQGLRGKLKKAFQSKQAFVGILNFSAEEDIKFNNIMVSNVY